MNVANAMAAAAAAYAAGAHLHDIRNGLRTFSATYYQAPGRLNVVDVGGVRVVIDYCHNAPGMRALGEFVERLAPDVPGTLEKPRRIGVIATAGDRRDQDMLDLGRAAAPHFDTILVREDVRLRGRERGETAELVADGVREAMREGSRCRSLEVVTDELEATRAALERANPGDLVVICADQTQQVWAELEDLSRGGLSRGL